ncbi:fork head domain-containing protein, partial [Mycena leptocephala]
IVKRIVFTHKILTLQEIYRELASRYQWFHEHQQDPAWKNSIRHNLSLNKVFKNIPSPLGKAGYWELDVSGGEGYKRRPKR